EYVSSLDQVLAADNQLTDLTPLKNLQNLKILDLSRNQIHDLSPLLNLINLEKLIIQSNPLNEESQAVIEELRKNGVRVLDDKAGRVLQEITVNSDRVTVRAGEDVQLELTANYKDGSTEDVTALAQWSSFDPGIVSVEKGRIHGHRAGETLILVSYKGKQTMLIAIVE
ncbi:MAG: leucine-rich repeat domain-containing protein, partial [Clostridia bacterium]